MVDKAMLPEGGFVTIHDESLSTADDPFGSLRGVSAYLEAGSHERIEVSLDEPLMKTQRLWAMVHHDTNQTQKFDSRTTEGDEDSPYVVDDLPMMADACITIE